MRPGKEQRDLSWGDLELKRDSEGTRFVELCRERQTKTRTGENLGNLRAKSLKCTKTRVIQIVVQSTVTWPIVLIDQLKCWQTNLRSTRV